MKQTLSSIALLASMTACAPLHQAPLVYSSKVTFGIDVSSSVTENPGGAISIGYKQVDAAYVPVAVAIPCPSVSNNCQDPMYHLKVLKGSNDQRTGDKVSEEKLAAAVKLLNEVQNAKSLLEDRQTLEKLAQQSVDAADARSQVKGLSGAEFKEATDNLNKAKGDLAAAQNATAGARAVVNTFGADEIATATNIVNSSPLRGDAYSVFGSFDGATRSTISANTSDGAKGDASLIVGKVFSTGVASQLLTEGMRDYYGSMAAERVAAKAIDCLKVVLADTNLKSDATALKSAIEVCNSSKVSGK